MLKASQFLRDNKQTLAEVAIAVGYDSEAAFSKAFKRWSGLSPGCYRRDARRGSDAMTQLQG
jgi:AraC-like DNA-binding protein